MSPGPPPKIGSGFSWDKVKGEKKDQDTWLSTLIQSLADDSQLLIEGKENTLMTKLALSVFPGGDKTLSKKAPNNESSDQNNLE